MWDVNLQNHKNILQKKFFHTVNINILHYLGLSICSDCIELIAFKLWFKKICVRGLIRSITICCVQMVSPRFPCTSSVGLYLFILQTCKKNPHTLNCGHLWVGNSYNGACWWIRENTPSKHLRKVKKICNYQTQLKFMSDWLKRMTGFHQGLYWSICLIFLHGRFFVCMFVQRGSTVQFQ